MQVFVDAAVIGRLNTILVPRLTTPTTKHDTQCHCINFTSTNNAPCSVPLTLSELIKASHDSALHPDQITYTINCLNTFLSVLSKLFLRYFAIISSTTSFHLLGVKQTSYQSQNWAEVIQIQITITRLLSPVAVAKFSEKKLLIIV